MPAADAATYRFNPFDVTKVWPHEDYPLIRGRPAWCSTAIPQNYFAEVEQAGVRAGQLRAGHRPSPDKMLQGRLFAYADAHRYRLGVNYVDLPVNCPHATEASNYYRDGAMQSTATAAAARSTSRTAIRTRPRRLPSTPNWPSS